MKRHPWVLLALTLMTFAVGVYVFWTAKFAPYVALALLLLGYLVLLTFTMRSSSRTDQILLASGLVAMAIALIGFVAEITWLAWAGSGAWHSFANQHPKNLLSASE